MAFTHCAHCRNQLSDQARICPSCGHPTPVDRAIRIFEAEEPAAFTNSASDEYEVAQPLRKKSSSFIGRILRFSSMTIVAFALTVSIIYITCRRPAKDFAVAAVTKMKTCDNVIRTMDFVRKSGVLYLVPDGGSVVQKIWDKVTGGLTNYAIEDYANHISRNISPYVSEHMVTCLNNMSCSEYKKRSKHKMAMCEMHYSDIVVMMVGRIVSGMGFPK